MANWTITDAAGAFLAQLKLHPGVHPSDVAESGWDWQDGQVAIAHAQAKDPAIHTFAAGAWSLDHAKLDRMLCRQIDEQREVRQLAALTPGIAKTVEYEHKAKEVRDFRSAGAAAIAGLPGADRRARFPFATTEADLSGDTIATVISRFETGMTGSVPALALIAAKAQVAKRAVKAASSRAAKEAAAQVDWDDPIDG